LILESYEEKTKKELSLNLENTALAKVEEEYAWRDSFLLKQEYTSELDYGIIKQEVNQKLESEGLSLEQVVDSIDTEKQEITIKNILTVYELYKHMEIPYNWQPAEWSTTVSLEDKFLNYISENKEDIVSLCNVISETADTDLLEIEHSFFTDSFVSILDSYFTKNANINPLIERISNGDFKSFLNSNPELMDFMKPSEIFYLYGKGVFSDPEMVNHFKSLVTELSHEAELSNLFLNVLPTKSSAIKKRTVALLYYNLIQFNEDLTLQGKANLMSERVRLLIKDKLAGFTPNRLQSTHMYELRNSIRIRLGNLDLNKGVFRIYRNLDKNSFQEINQIIEGKENHRPWLFLGVEGETEKAELVDRLKEVYHSRGVNPEDKFNMMMNTYKGYLTSNQVELVNEMVNKNQVITSTIKEKGFEQDLKLLESASEGRILSQEEVQNFFTHLSRDSIGVKVSLYSSNNPFTPFLCFSSSGTVFEKHPIQITAEIPLSEYGVRLWSSKSVGLSLQGVDESVGVFDEWNYLGELNEEYIESINIQRKILSEKQLDYFYESELILNEFTKEGEEIISVARKVSTAEEELFNLFFDEDNKNYVKVNDFNDAGTEKIIEITKRDMILPDCKEYLIESNTKVFRKGKFLYFIINDGFANYYVPIREYVSVSEGGEWLDIPSTNKEGAPRTRKDFIESFTEVLKSQDSEIELETGEKIYSVTGIELFDKIENSYYSESNPVRIFKGIKKKKETPIYVINIKRENLNSILPNIIDADYTYLYSLNNFLFYYDKNNKVVIPLAKEGENGLITDNIFTEFEKEIIPWMTATKDISVLEKISAASMLNDLRLDDINKPYNELLKKAISEGNSFKENFRIKDQESARWFKITFDLTKNIKEKVRNSISDKKIGLIGEMEGKRVVFNWGKNKLIIQRNNKGRIVSSHTGMGVAHMMGLFDKVTVKKDVFGIENDVEIDLAVKGENGERFFPSDFETLRSNIDEQLMAKGVYDNQVIENVRNRIISSLATHNHLADLKASEGDTIKGLKIIADTLKKMEEDESSYLVYFNEKHGSLVYETEYSESDGSKEYISFVLKPETIQGDIIPITTFQRSDITQAPPQG
jgi:hypothetical protein